MKITAITRYKHGELHAALKRLGWTQAKLALEAGLSGGVVGNIINLVRRPSQSQANAIQSALGKAGEYLDALAEWPETFEGLKPGFKREQTAEVELESLIGCREAMLLPAPEAEDTTGLDAALEDMLNDLSERERFTVKELYFNGKDLGDVGEKLNCCRQNVKQIEARALKKLKNPLRVSKLDPHLARDCALLP